MMVGPDDLQNGQPEFLRRRKARQMADICSTLRRTDAAAISSGVNYDMREILSRRVSCQGQTAEKVTHKKEALVLKKLFVAFGCSIGGNFGLL